MNPRVLFILKSRDDYGHNIQHCNVRTRGHTEVSTGLLNSATFVRDMLVDEGVESKLVVVTDNNDIDREVTAYRPTHVIIEALWVVPEKFEILHKLHPSVEWIIRFHSETPFIASEGIAMKWLHGYMKKKNVVIAANAPRFVDDISNVLRAAGYEDEEIEARVRYLPNYYPVGDIVMPHHHGHKEAVSVGCFGAIRPLKNHLTQAIAALLFARNIGKKLHFHINVGRVEMKGDPILHNIQGLFAGLEDEGHKLVMHQWMPHEEFVHMIRHNIEIGMQVTFSETFNIVAADLITNGVPTVVSKEVPWAVVGIADPTSTNDIASSLETAWNHPKFNVIGNTTNLMLYNHKTKAAWNRVFGKHHH